MKIQRNRQVQKEMTELCRSNIPKRAGIIQWTNCLVSCLLSFEVVIFYAFNQYYSAYLPVLINDKSLIVL